MYCNNKTKKTNYVENSDDDVVIVVADACCCRSSSTMEAVRHPGRAWSKDKDPNRNPRFGTLYDRLYMMETGTYSQYQYQVPVVRRGHIYWLNNVMYVQYR
jgi:hypothetical protein